MRPVVVFLLAAIAAAASAEEPQITLKDGTMRLRADDVCFDLSSGGQGAASCVGQLASKADVDTTSALAATLSGKVDSLAASADAADASIDALQDNADDLSSALGQLSSALDDASASLQTAVGDLDDVDTRLGGAIASANTLSLEVATQATRTTDVSSGLGTLSSHVGTLDTGLDDVVELTTAVSSSVDDVGADLKDVSNGLGSLGSRVDTLETGLNDVVGLTAAISASVDDVESDLKTYIDDKHEDTFNRAVTHTTNTISDAVEDLATQQAGKLETYDARFDEVEERYGEAGTYTYSFDGSEPVNRYFAYQFAVDYGLPGSTGATNFAHWFIEVEAYLVHCGGGCPGTYFKARYFWNAYCEVATLSTENGKSGSGGGGFTVARVADQHNGYNFGCGSFNIIHTPGSEPYGGPFFIKVRSNKPLKKLHGPIYSLDSGCRFNCDAGPRCTGGSCSPWACAISQCPGHILPPAVCDNSWDRSYVSDGKENYGGKCRVF